jgi:hypothetical protein
MAIQRSFGGVQMKSIRLVILLLLITAQVVGASLKVELDLRKGSNDTIFSVLDFSKTDFEYPLNEFYGISDKDEGVFKIRVLDSSKKVLYEHLCYESFRVFDGEDLSETSILFTIPEFASQKTFKIFYKGKEKISFDIPSTLCNQDKVCAGYENYYSCPSDCMWFDEDGTCNSKKGDYFCDKDCIYDPDCEEANCNDKIKNQDETSMDNGGVCGVSCFDGKKNGDETGIDCGGSCVTCPEDSLKDILNKWIKSTKTLKDTFIDINKLFSLK